MSDLHKVLLTHPRIERFVSSFLGDWSTIFTLHRPPAANGSYEGTDPELLAATLAFAASRGYEFVSVDELVDRAIKGQSLARSLCFTLDDGYADQLEVLVPVLLQYNAKPTLFVISDLVDGVLWPWDNQLAHLCWYASAGVYQVQLNGQALILDLQSHQLRKVTRRLLTNICKSMQREQIEELLKLLETTLRMEIPQNPPKEYLPVSWDQLRSNEKQGLRIGCHAKSHFTFNALTDAEIVSELAHSRRRLAHELANPSEVFCYPSGKKSDFSLHHQPLVQSAGFKAAVSTLSKNTCSKAVQNAPYCIERIGMPQDLGHFARYISWFEYLRGRW